MGMFVLRPTATESSTFADYLLGTPLGAVLPGVHDSDRIGCASGAALVRYSFDPDTALYLDGGYDAEGSGWPAVGGTQTPVSALPTGFTLTSVKLYRIKNGSALFWVQFSEAHELLDPTGSGVFDYPAALPSMAALCAEGCGVRVFGRVSIATVPLGSLFVAGTYESEAVISASASESPSASTSPSASLSPSASTSASTSPSHSMSPSASRSPSASVSPSISPSASASPSISPLWESSQLGQPFGTLIISDGEVDVDDWVAGPARDSTPTGRLHVLRVTGQGRYDAWTSGVNAWQTVARSPDSGFVLPDTARRSFVSASKTSYVVDLSVVAGRIRAIKFVADGELTGCSFILIVNGVETEHDGVYDAAGTSACYVPWPGLRSTDTVEIGVKKDNGTQRRTLRGLWLLVDEAAGADASAPADTATASVSCFSYVGNGTAQDIEVVFGRGTGTPVPGRPTLLWIFGTNRGARIPDPVTIEIYGSPTGMSISGAGAFASPTHDGPGFESHASGASNYANLFASGYWDVPDDAIGTITAVVGHITTGAMSSLRVSDGYEGNLTAQLNMPYAPDGPGGWVYYSRYTGPNLTSTTADFDYSPWLPPGMYRDFPATMSALRETLFKLRMQLTCGPDMMYGWYNFVGSITSVSLTVTYQPPTVPPSVGVRYFWHDQVASVDGVLLGTSGFVPLVTDVSDTGFTVTGAADTLNENGERFSVVAIRDPTGTFLRKGSTAFGSDAIQDVLIDGSVFTPEFLMLIGDSDPRSDPPWARS